MKINKILMFLRATFGRHRVKIYQLLKLYKYYNKETTKIDKSSQFKKNQSFSKNGLYFGSAPDELINIKSELEKYFGRENKHNVKILLAEHKKIALDVFNKYFRLTCEDYFGEPVLVHNLALCRAIKSKTSTLASDNWHYDLSGNRIKIFVVIDCINGGVGTELVLGSNTEKRFPHFICSRRTPNSILKRYKNNIITHLGKKNTFYFFDTNMWHRGDFSQKDHTIVSSRLTLQYDVVTTQKFELMKKLNFPKVGFDVNINS